jgi:transposase
VRAAQIFVGVLNASNYTYDEATWTQSLPDWIGAHVRMFDFFGGEPGQIVSDNLKAGVITRISDRPVSRLHELLPWNWQPEDKTERSVKAV